MPNKVSTGAVTLGAGIPQYMVAIESTTPPTLSVIATIQATQAEHR
ncbi:MAG: hypothetical protein M3082_00995 [Candidatus Dormibacteraeota bacterium]|nr:hypothetical protein [Candidatus Dormibacteraeota bacterium]